MKYIREYIMRLLDKWACSHKWYKYQRTEVYAYPYRDKEFPLYSIDTLICNKCGKIKQIKLN